MAIRAAIQLYNRIRANYPEIEWFSGGDKLIRIEEINYRGYVFGSKKAGELFVVYIELSTPWPEASRQIEETLARRPEYLYGEKRDENIPRIYVRRPPYPLISNDQELGIHYDLPDGDYSRRESARIATISDDLMQRWLTRGVER